MTQQPHSEPGSKSPLYRALGLFSDVRPGEAGVMLAMLGNLFLTMLAYYVVKTVREPLILASGGAELKTYASAAQALSLMALVPAYGWLSERVGRRQLITGVIVFFVACIQCFYFAARLGVPYLGFVFYVWVGVFSLAMVAQFWSYANDVYERDAGERLFPVIALGATLGSPVGSFVAARLFDAGVAPFEMLQVTAVVLILSLGVYRSLDASLAGLSGDSSKAAPLSRSGGFELVFASPYLRTLALIMILLNVVNTTGEYILGRSVLEAARAAAASLEGDPAAHGEFISRFIGSFYGDFFFVVNVATVAIQALIVSRLVRYLGVRGALLALPIIAFRTYSMIAAGAGFVALRWAKTAENSTDYSVMNTAKNLVWLPTSRDEKYKAKQAIDTFFVRFGDVLAAGLVFVGTEWLLFEIRGFALTNLALIVIWTVCVLRLASLHARASTR